MNCDNLGKTHDSGKLICKVSTKSVNFPVCSMRQAEGDFPDWGRDGAWEDKREW
jgi:hypothetical protein